MLVSAFSALYSLARSEKSCTLMLVLAFLEVSFECTGGAKLAPYTISTCERVQAELHPGQGRRCTGGLACPTPPHIERGSRNFALGPEKGADLYTSARSRPHP